MSISKTLFTANTLAVSTGGGGIMVWITGNAPALAIIITALMGFVSGAFYLLNYLENKRHNREMEKDK